MKEDFSFRFAKEKDTALILFFIKELASYEKMLDEVVITEDILYKWIFEEKMAEVLFILSDEKEVGFALFYNNFSTFQGRAGIFVEDLFVLSQYRGRGYGRAILNKLAEIALERGYGRLEWTCLNWNKPSIDFYLSIGAKAIDDWTIYRISGETLENMAKAN